MKVLLFKKTVDSDLIIGQKVCYKDTNGVYNKLGVITDTYTKDGFIHYILNTSFGSYLADELKLIEEIKYNQETKEIDVTIGRYNLNQTFGGSMKFNSVSVMCQGYSKLIDPHSKEVEHLFIALHNFKIENNIF